MRNMLFAAVAASALMISNAASAGLIADFQLNNSFVNNAGGGVGITNNGGLLTAAALTFGANQGPTLTGLGSLSVYTLETRFAFDEISGYRKIADFQNRTNDQGLYILNGALNYYPVITGSDTIAPSTYFTVTLVRDASNMLTGYLNGMQQWSFLDSSGLAVINGSLDLFRDDFQVGPHESSGGVVDYIQLSVPDGGAVPEPATWALMITGFGLAGVALRRRRVAIAA